MSTTQSSSTSQQSQQGTNDQTKQQPQQGTRDQTKQSQQDAIDQTKQQGTLDQTKQQQGIEQKSQVKEVKIANPEDIENNKVALTQGDSVHLDLKDTSLDKNQFIQLFDQMAKTQKTDFQLDMSNIELDEDRFNALNNCVKNWDLKHFHLNASNCKFSDSSFTNLCNSLKKMQNLEKLHLVLENVDMNRAKRAVLEDLLSTLPNAKNVAINTRSSNMTQNDIQRIHDLVVHFPHFHIWHDYPSLLF